ncbi:MAG: hypothetical protein KDA89_00525 [Planctomycetaceae bacterium]|nr:hypothetical protein [Planctomycetaceae bacterium]
MDNENNEGESKQRPAAEFTGSGGIKLAVWKHKNDNGPDRYSAVIERTYRTEDGEFHTVPYLRDSDLLRAQQLLEQADAWIEQDKGRLRGMRSADQQSQR